MDGVRTGRYDNPSIYNTIPTMVGQLEWTSLIVSLQNSHLH